MLSNHLILCPSLLPLPQSFPAPKSFPMSWLFPSGGQTIGASASASVLQMNSGRISFRIEWFDLLAVQGTFKNLFQHHNSEATILWCSAFFMVQLSHAYMTTGKTIALTFLLLAMWCLCFLICQGRGTRDKIDNIHWIIENATEFQKNIYFCFFDYTETFDCVVTTNCGKFWKRWDTRGRSQDGGGIGQGDHFLSYKFTERTIECWTNFTKQLLITSRGYQAPIKATHYLRREVGQNIKDKKGDKRARDGDPSRGRES